MQIKVRLRGRLHTVIVPEKSTVSDAARKVGVYPNSAIFIIDGKIVPSDNPLKDGIELYVLPAASGG
jgi:sulfur carrier protein ThiS